MSSPFFHEEIKVCIHIVNSYREVDTGTVIISGVCHISMDSNSRASGPSLSV